MLVGMLQALRDTVDALHAIDVDGLSDTELHELVTGLQREGERLEAAQARLLARWDARCVWADDGSKSAGARLARETESCKAGAYRRVKRARRLTAMPFVAAGFEDGSLSADVVDLLVRVNVPRRAELFGRDEELLVRECRRQ